MEGAEGAGWGETEEQEEGLDSREEELRRASAASPLSRAALGMQLPS